ncbi:MAG: hypothetical protein RL757_2645 [Bacteroidota bacterium]|jgi:NAD(P)-dependent dehydrogenase (short-subunit alcohol dehydrogenase family)
MKTIVITGVSTGIGFDAARFLIEKGWTVFGSVRNQADAQKTADILGGSFVPLIFDVTDNLAIENAASQVEKWLKQNNIPHLDALLNNAGIAVNGPLQHLPIDDLAKQFDINVVGVIRVTQAFSNLLGAKKGNPHVATIINISSVSAFVTQPFLGPYSASKAALEKLSDALRREMKVVGTKVVLVEPGPIRTPIWTKARETANPYAGSDYEPYMKQVGEIVNATEASALPVVQVSELIYKILNTENPKARYMIAPKSWIIKMITRLPDSWVDGLFKKQFAKLERGEGATMRGI